MAQWREQPPPTNVAGARIQNLALSGLSLLLDLVLASRGFSPDTPLFPSPQITNISEFQFDLKCDDHRLFK